MECDKGRREKNTNTLLFKNNFKILLRIVSSATNQSSVWSLAKSISHNFVESCFPLLISEIDIKPTSKDEQELFAEQFAPKSTLEAPIDQPMYTLTAVPYKMTTLSSKFMPIYQFSLFFQILYDEGIFTDGWKTTSHSTANSIVKRKVYQWA